MLAAACLVAALAPAAQTRNSRRPQPRLNDFYQQWAAEAGPLLHWAERAALEQLEGPGARERFLNAFWAARPERLRERWQQNRSARDQLRERSPAMERAVLLAGKPEYRQTVEPCESSLRPIAIWFWDRSRIARQLGRLTAEVHRNILLTFVQQKSFDPRSMLLWSPASGVDLTFEPKATTPDSGASADDSGTPAGAVRALDQAERRGCLTPSDRERLEEQLGYALSWRDFVEAMGWSGGDDDSEPSAWVDAFLRTEQVLDPQRMAAPGVDLQIDPLGENNRRTAMRLRLLVPAGRLNTVGASSVLDRVTITGDIFLGARLVDTFVATHHVTGGAPVASADSGDGRIALDAYRRLPAGTYRLELRAADGLDRGIYRASLSLDVPAAEEPTGMEDLGRLARRETIALKHLPSVEMLLPEGRVLGSTFKARVVLGPGIARVVFRRDGEAVATADGPPWARSIELPNRHHRIDAEAFGADGKLLARHGIEVEREENPFSIALERPPPDRFAEALDLAVRVDVPEAHELERIDCHLERRLLASMEAPPFRCRVPAGIRPALSFVRAVATLRSGEQVEDLAFLGDAAPDEVDVRLVDLLLSVTSRGSAPAADLTANDFRVLHRGAEASIRDFRSLADRPLTVALLMDVSSSMGRSVRVAASSAQRFFESILTEHDTASLTAFNHDLHRLAGFTGDTALLRYAAEGLRAWGATRLYDGIALAVSSFAGRPDRRALVVLSDGADTDSTLAFEQVLTLAELAGVVVYPIALRVNDPETTAALRQLAEATGGQYHIAPSVSELDRVYRDIERALRSQYLIAFEPPAGIQTGSDGLRDIEVEVLRDGLSATGLRLRERQ